MFQISLISCEEETSKPYTALEFNLSDSTLFSKEKLMNCFSKISFIALEDNPYKTINQIFKIEQHRDMLYLLDKHKNLFLYDTNGRFYNIFDEKKVVLYNLGVLHDFYIFNNKVYLLGYKKILITDLKLNEISEINIENLGIYPQSFAITNNGLVFFEQRYNENMSIFVFCNNKLQIIKRIDYKTKFPEFIRILHNSDGNVVFPFISEKMTFNLVNFNNGLHIKHLALSLKNSIINSPDKIDLQLQDIYHSDSLSFGLFRYNQSLFQFLMINKNFFVWNCFDQSLIQPFGYLNIYKNRILSSRPAFKFLEQYNSYVHQYNISKIRLNFAPDSISSLSNPIIYVYEF